MSKASVTTYSLLGLLAVQPWTGYELTRQIQRSLRFAWPSSEGHLYREQKRLVELGWATVERESVGRRLRNRYSITPDGRDALAAWLATRPGEPAFQVEGILRTFFGDFGTVEDLAATMRATSDDARSMLDEMLGFVDEYLDDGGPFPGRLHLVAIAIEIITALLAEIEGHFENTAAEIETWPSTTELGLTPATRTRLERIRAAHGHSQDL